MRVCTESKGAQPPIAFLRVASGDDGLKPKPFGFAA
jgi:hypothetical protein